MKKQLKTNQNKYHQPIIKKFNMENKMFFHGMFHSIKDIKFSNFKGSKIKFYNTDNKKYLIHIYIRQWFLQKNTLSNPAKTRCQNSLGTKNKTAIFRGTNNLFNSIINMEMQQYNLNM